MCGIGGVIGYNKQLGKRNVKIAKAIFKGIETRGRDAFGVYFHPLGQLYKFPDSLTTFILNGGSIINADTQGGILMHTRAATKGLTSKLVNNHPFKSSISGRFILAHNGRITNDEETKTKYSLKYDGETDSLIIVNLIDYLVTEENKSVVDAIKFTMEELEGSRACWLFDTNTEDLYLFRNSNPLNYAIKDNYLYFASTDTILSTALEQYDMKLDIKEISEGKIYKFVGNKLQEVGEYKIGNKSTKWDDSFWYDKPQLNGNSKADFMGVTININEKSHEIKIYGDSLGVIKSKLITKFNGWTVNAIYGTKNNIYYDTVKVNSTVDPKFAVHSVLYELSGFMELEEILTTNGIIIKKMSRSPKMNSYNVTFEVTSDFVDIIEPQLKSKGIVLNSSNQFTLHKLKFKKMGRVKELFKEIGSIITIGEDGVKYD